MQLNYIRLFLPNVLIAKPITMGWKKSINDYNLSFYNNLGITSLRNFAKIGGFDTYTDLDLIFDQIKNAASVLEIGAGYGRCIDYLLSRSYQGEIVAVEICAAYHQYLLQHYGDKVNLLHRDIKKLSLQKSVAVALWMWSGIIDFSRKEQEQNILKIFQLLGKDGKLFIDVPKFGIQTIAEHQDDKHLYFDTQYGKLYCFMPDYKDMEKYALTAGFEGITYFDYYTATGKERTIYTLQKN